LKLVFPLENGSFWKMTSVLNKSSWGESWTCT